MRITPKTTYAVRCMVYFKNHNDRSYSLKEISSGTAISAPFLSKILQTLAKSGYLLSRKGRHGGFRLNRSPEAISVYDIVRETSSVGKVLKTGCSACLLRITPGKPCQLSALWADLDLVVSMHLRSRRLSQL